MAESEIAEWSANISAKPYGERVYHVSSAIARQTLFRLLDIRTVGLEHLSTAPPVIIAPVHRSNLDLSLIHI